jgi:hypothetical protein
MIETVTAIAILAFVLGSVVALLMSGIIGLGVTRQRTLAEQTAANEIEAIRQLPYASVGTVGGNPGGTLPASTTISEPGLQGTQTVQIVWVNDPVPTAYETYADYKRVTVTVTRSADSQVLTKQTTYVGPASQSSYGGVNDAIVQAQVMDMGDNQPVAGVPVSISDGPSSNAGDTTNANGTVTFPALQPNPSSGGQAYYDLAVTPPAGYTALADDVSPSSAAHVQLTAGQTFSTVLRIYQPATVNVSVSVAGAAYTGAGTITLTSSRPTLTASLSNGTAQFTGVVPGVSYTANVKFTYTTGSVSFASSPQTVPTSYPTNLTSSYSLSLPSLVVTVYKKSGTVCSPVSAATVTVTGGPQSVNVSQSTPSSPVTGIAAFTLPSGGSYTIKAKSGSTTVTASSQTVQAAPAATNIHMTISGGTC